MAINMAIMCTGVCAGGQKAAGVPIQHRREQMVTKRTRKRVQHHAERVCIQLMYICCWRVT